MWVFHRFRVRTHVLLSYCSFSSPSDINIRATCITHSFFFGLYFLNTINISSSVAVFVPTSGPFSIHLSGTMRYFYEFCNLFNELQIRMNTHRRSTMNSATTSMFLSMTRHSRNKPTISVILTVSKHMTLNHVDITFDSKKRLSDKSASINEIELSNIAIPLNITRISGFHIKERGIIQWFYLLQSTLIWLVWVLRYCITMIKIRGIILHIRHNSQH